MNYHPSSVEIAISVLVILYLIVSAQRKLQPCKRRLGILCFLWKQRIKDPVNPVDPVKK